MSLYANGWFTVQGLFGTVGAVVLFCGRIPQPAVETPQLSTKLNECKRLINKCLMSYGLRATSYEYKLRVTSTNYGLRVACTYSFHLYLVAISYLVARSS